MSWFSTSAFQFELPGDGWDERTQQRHAAPDRPRHRFAVSRAPKNEGETIDVEAAVRAFPELPNTEREILRKAPVTVGLCAGEDLSFVQRSLLGAEYIRIVVVEYYDRILAFHWMGPASDRDEIDERAERGLESILFRRQP